MSLEKSYSINRKINANFVRVIDPLGNNLGVISKNDALIKAQEFDMDLVEVSKGKVPTCKILDYGKLKYQESKKEKKKEKKNHAMILRPKIATHDLQTKINLSRRLLEKGSNINFMIKFKGRETSHPDIGENLLKSVISALNDCSLVSRNISYSGNKMDMTLSPKK